MIRLSLLFAFSLLMNSCSDDATKISPDEAVRPPTATGVTYFRSILNIDVAYSNLKTALTDNENIEIVKELDHSQNAVSVDLNLMPTQIIFFGNPTLGTPLMRKNQLAGLDLPLKVLFYEDQEDVFAFFNSTHYLASRYGVGEVESLSQISGALNNLVGTAVEARPEQTDDQNVDLHEGVVTVKSSNTFETTYDKLKFGIESNENLSVAAELDHRQNAENVGMELRSTKVIMFGNPRLGTPLMQSVRSIGLDLPQKMLVWENANGAVFISYNDPAFLKEKHHVEGEAEEVQQISNALDMLATMAAEVN